MSAWKTLLSSVPVTDLPSKVVTLHDPLAPPPALIPTWREAADSQRRLAHLKACRASDEAKFAARLDDARQALAALIDEAQQALARRDRDIDTERRKLADAQERWAVMTAPMREGEADEETNAENDR